MRGEFGAPAALARLARGGLDLAGAERIGGESVELVAPEWPRGPAAWCRIAIGGGHD